MPGAVPAAANLLKWRTKPYVGRGKVRTTAKERKLVAAAEAFAANARKSAPPVKTFEPFVHGSLVQANKRYGMLFAQILGSLLDRDLRNSFIATVMEHLADAMGLSFHIPASEFWGLEKQAVTRMLRAMGLDAQYGVMVTMDRLLKAVQAAAPKVWGVMGMKKIHLQTYIGLCYSSLPPEPSRMWPEYYATREAWVASGFEVANLLWIVRQGRKKLPRAPSYALVREYRSWDDPLIMILDLETRCLVRQYGPIPLPEHAPEIIDVNASLLSPLAATRIYCRTLRAALIPRSDIEFAHQYYLVAAELIQKLSGAPADGPAAAMAAALISSWAASDHGSGAAAGAALIVQMLNIFGCGYDSGYCSSVSALHAALVDISPTVMSGFTLDHLQTWILICFTVQPSREAWERFCVVRDAWRQGDRDSIDLIVFFDITRRKIRYDPQKGIPEPLAWDDPLIPLITRTPDGRLVLDRDAPPAASTSRARKVRRTLASRVRVPASERADWRRASSPLPKSSATRKRKRT